MSALASQLAGIAAVALIGCGASHAGPSAARPSPAVDAGAAAPAAVDPLPSLDALASRGPTDAPLMREIARFERAAPRSPDVRADRDLCVRAFLAAPSPVRAYFADASGAARGETTIGASGAVPPRGPACARKGEALHLVVETSTPAAPHTEPAARAVIFAAP